MRQAHFFTFGSNHVDDDGRSLGQRFVAIEGDMGETRTKLAEARGMKWSFQYTAKQFEGQAARFGLHEISIDHVYLPEEKR